MTLLTAPATSLEDSDPAAIQLFDDEYKGVEILGSLQTVIRGKRLKDPIGLIAANVVKNEQTHVDFVRLIRKLAGFEAPAQVKKVTHLLQLAELVDHIKAADALLELSDKVA